MSVHKQDPHLLSRWNVRTARRQDKQPWDRRYRRNTCFEGNTWPNHLTLHPEARKQIFVTAAVYRLVTTSPQCEQAMTQPYTSTHHVTQPTLRRDEMCPSQGWRWKHTAWSDVTTTLSEGCWIYGRRIKVGMRTATQKPPAHNTSRRPHFLDDLTH
jgi:hypothetical protein